LFSQDTIAIEVLEGAIPGSLAVLAGALVLDLLIGEPPETLHPVVWIGKVIGKTREFFEGSPGARLAGGVVAILIPAVSGGLAYLVITFGAYFWELAGPILGILLLKSTISVKSLLGTVKSVGEQIESDPDGAREGLLALVGRDRSELSEGEMRSAAIESLFENLVDSVIAPLFYFALGAIFGYGAGVALAIFYKSVNTLDSMLGYRTEALRDYGYLSARLDDLLIWFPARISVPFVSLVAFSLRAISISLRDWKEPPSPNSGWPMGAAAGGLRVKLVKKGVYTIAGEYELPGAEDLRAAVGLAVRSIDLYLLVLILIFLFF